MILYVDYMFGDTIQEDGGNIKRSLFNETLI